MTTRQKYSKDFKLDAVNLVLDQGYTRREAARSLDINDQILGRWVKEHREYEDGQAFRGNGKLTPEQEKIQRLKAENKRLEMERVPRHLARRQIREFGYLPNA
jgi:transposase